VRGLGRPDFERSCDMSWGETSRPIRKRIGHASRQACIQCSP
jgi:hypothetical protein